MALYTGCTCEVCNKKFEDNDDVVICPTCGTPHHRLCYQENKGCINKSKHKDNFEWTREVKTENTKEKTVSCDNCGAQNPSNAKFCMICGRRLNPLHINLENAEEKLNDERVNKTELDGVSIEDIKTYLGKNGQRIANKFLLGKALGMVPFSLPALILGPFYYLYRKMNKKGLILLLITLITDIPKLIYTIEFMKAYYLPEMFNLVVPFSQTILDKFDPLSTLSMCISLVLHIYCFRNAMRDLFDHSIEDIKHIKDLTKEETKEKYHEVLTLRGKPKLLLPILLFITITLVQYAIIIYSMPELLNLLMTLQ